MGDCIDVVVPNIVEFNLRRIGAMMDPHAAAGYLAVGATLADESAFWADSQRVQVLHPGTDPDWWGDIHYWLGQPPPPLICPAGRGHLVDDLLSDATALRALRAELDGHYQVNLRCWGATAGVYRLTAAIRSWGHKVASDIPPPERYWTSLYLETKLSCADLAGRLPLLRVPATITVMSWDELQGAVDGLLASGRAAIVKAPDGVAGIGSAVARAGEGTGTFWREVSQEPLLRDFPVLVQEFIGRACGVGCPAVDLLVEDVGVTDIASSILSVDGHRLSSVKVGAGILPDSVEAAVRAVGQAAGEEAGHMGYRGWLGVDCVTDESGQIYVTEINARRTGGMHLISMVRRLGASRAVVRCESMLAVPTASYAEVRPALGRLREQGVCIFPTTARGLRRDRPTIGILTAGATPAEADDVAGRFISTLS